MTAGPKVKKFRPTKDVHGNVIKDSEIWLGPEIHPNLDLSHLPVAFTSLEKLKVGDRLFFRDTRNKKREFTITKTTENGCIARCSKTTYLETGMELFTNSDHSSAPIIIGELPRVEQFIMLHPGDFLRLRKDAVPGEPAKRDEDDNLISHAHISCTLGEIFDQVREGNLSFLMMARLKVLFAR